MCRKMTREAWLSVLLLCVYLHHGYGQDFGYSGDLGPSHWGEKYSTCVGKHQSPIDISERNINFIKLDALEFENFEIVPEAMSLTNNGHTVMLKIKSEKVPELSGGPLQGTYRFEQLHFHWGENDSEGSENKINHNSFPLELHMVFYKTQYESMQEATNHRDGLTVLAFLYKIEDQNNTHYENIIDALEQVREPNTTGNISETTALGSLITTDTKKYFTYDGSLTTPPCSEIVIWIEFRKPIGLAHSQLEVFRSLNNEEGKMTHNFRPTQPLYDRIIYYSSDAGTYDIDDNNIDDLNSAGSENNLHYNKNNAIQNSYCILLTIVASSLTLFLSRL